MRTSLLFAAICSLLLLIINQANAAPPLTCEGSTLCSRTFYASGNCDGQDQLAALKIDEIETKLVGPWEPVPITIVGVHLKLISGEVTYAFAGNSSTPDIMRWLDERDTYYPQGTGFAFPAFGSKAHIDFHYNCLKGSFQAFYTVYYKIDRPANTASLAEEH